MIASQVSRYKNWGTNNAPAVWKSYTWLRTGSPDFDAWTEQAIASSDWKLNSTIDLVDAVGQVLQTTNSKNQVSSMMWDVRGPRAQAHVTSGASNQILYEGFENYPSGAPSINTTDTRTGLKSYSSSYTVILPSAGTYSLKYWKKTNGGSWQLIQQTISANTVIGDVNSLIDEIRLCPPNADMTSLAYDRYGNTITECDANVQPSYIEYDEFHRKKLTRDKNKNIITFYNFKVD